VQLAAGVPAGGSGLTVVTRLVLTPIAPPVGAPTKKWWIKVRGIDGLWDGDVRDERYPNPGRRGETSGELLESGKTFVIRGSVIGRDLDGLREGQLALLEAFRDSEPGIFGWQVWNRVPVEIIARKNQKIDMAEEQATDRYERTFAIQLRADDPVSYSIVTKSATTPAGAVGNVFRVRTYPRSYPIPGRPRTRTYDSTGVVNAGAENDGPQDSYPVTELHGPMTNPVFTNLTTGKRIAWIDLDIGAGEYVLVDHYTGEVLRGGTTPAEGELDVVHTDFWPIVPGINVFSLVAFSSGPDAYAVTRWRDGY
jgi:hypothetical protein